MVFYDDLGFCWNAFELMRSKVAFYSNCLGGLQWLFVCYLPFTFSFVSLHFRFGSYFFLLLDLYSESNVLFVLFSLADTVLDCQIRFSHHNSTSQKKGTKASLIELDYLQSNDCQFVSSINKYNTTIGLKTTRIFTLQIILFIYNNKKKRS